MISSVSTTINFWFDAEYLDLFTNGKFILNGLNSTGKTTILKAIEEAINSEGTDCFEHLAINNEPQTKGVKEIILYLENGVSLPDVEAFYIKGDFDKGESIEVIRRISKEIEEHKLIDTLCFFNDQFKKYLPGLIVFKRYDEIKAERWGNEIPLEELTVIENKLIMIFMLLANERRFLLLDDFEFGLSISIQARVLSAMMKFTEANVFERPFIISTHSPLVANEFPDNVQNLK